MSDNSLNAASDVGSNSTGVRKLIRITFARGLGSRKWSASAGRCQSNRPDLSEIMSDASYSNSHSTKSPATSRRRKVGRVPGNKCRVDRCNAVANQRNAGRVCDYVGVRTRTVKLCWPCLE